MKRYSGLLIMLLPALVFAAPGDKITVGGMALPLSADSVTDGATNKTFTATEKAKLSALDATQLRDRSTHTGTQSATTIATDDSHQFATTAEKSAWNAKQDALGFTPMSPANNLSDLSSPAAARAALGLGNVSNTADSDKPVSIAMQTELNAKAPLAAPTFTDSVTAPSYNSNAADGYHMVRPYNSTGTYSGTPSVGMIQTTPTGPQWYTGSVWEAIGGTSLPSQTSNSGKFLTTNGTSASWASIAAGSGITISTDIPTDTGAAYLNDTTHVLTVASSTGYTAFTGSFTAWDTTPAAFSFTDETDVAADGGQSCGSAITVADITWPSAISVTGDTGFGYKVNGGAFTSASGTVALNDTVAPCVNRSSSNSTATTATVTIGGVSDTYSVTTVASGSGYSDNFTGTDGTALPSHDSNWMSPGGTYLASNFSITGNAVTTNSAWLTAGAYYNASTSDTSQITSKLVTNSAQSVDKHVSVRNTGSAIGYSARLVGSATGTYTSVGFKKGGAGIGSTCSGLSYSTTADHVIKLVASGTSTVTLTFFVDGTQVCQTTDSSSTITSGHPGFYVTGNGTVGNNAFDDWQDY